jgi:hypothetical protein
MKKKYTIVNFNIFNKLWSNVTQQDVRILIIKLRWLRPLVSSSFRTCKGYDLFVCIVIPRNFILELQIEPGDEYLIGFPDNYTVKDIPLV